MKNTFPTAPRGFQSGWDAINLRVAVGLRHHESYQRTSDNLFRTQSLFSRAKHGKVRILFCDGIVLQPLDLLAAIAATIPSLTM